MSLHTKTELSISQALFTLALLVFFFILLNGYALNLVSGYQANNWLVLAGLAVELAIALAAARVLVSVRFDFVELIGFLVVVAGVWLYFVAASLPTLLPPTQSVDAVRHYLQALFSYPNGTLVSWYPAGGAFVVAILSHWVGAAPLRVLHPTAASFVALSAGAAYGITCALLPPKRRSKIAALAAPALLFAPWSYFAGAINWEQYFYAQIFAQYFVVAALWYIASYAATSDWRFLVLLGAALLGVVAAYPYLVALPMAVFGLVVLARVRPTPGPSLKRRGVVALAAFAALLIFAAMALQQGGILELKTFQIATEGDVGAGGVANPSLETLGGPIFLLLALVGIPLAWRTGARGPAGAILAFVAVWLLQLGALVIVQPVFQVSGYRIDKTFYILVYPLAILAALLPAWALDRWLARIEHSPRRLAAAFVAILLAASVGVVAFRPPIAYAPFSESELETALWAKEHLDTYQISYLEPETARAYWLAFGLWRENLPNEWFQWIPAGVKLGPKTFDEWLRDPAWPRWVLVPDVTALRAPLPKTIYASGKSAILEKETLTTAAPTPTYASTLYFGSAIKLLGYDLPRATFSPGEMVTLTTYTESRYPPSETVGWRAELVDRHGNVVSKANGDPFGGKYPLQRWPPGRFARDMWSLPLDAKLAPGVYKLQLGLYCRTDGAFVDVHTLPSEQGAQDHYAAAALAQIKLPVPPPSAEELGATKRLDARFGDNLVLASYALRYDRETRTAHLSLYWQSRAKPNDDYTVFVHLLDPSGKIVAQKDSPPRDGAYPTSVWDVGEIVQDEYRFVFSADTPLPASIAIGLYSQPNMQRLPVGTDDKVILDFRF
ncbi:MAG: hypothetical protein HY782_01915 [Chloroflexi bacterium]|nr:hypothetical protein [Chloroflexota bacterium]